MKTTTSLLALLAISVGIGGLAEASDSGAAAAEQLGTVSFSVSCSPAVSGDFNRGVALLHDFWYEEARPQFERILKADPACAMAHWGIAMSGFHQIWDRPDAAGMSEGWREMQAAQSAKTPRERAYVAALREFFRPEKTEYQARIDAYAAAMKQLYAKYPQDVNAGAFYALAILASESPTDDSLSHEHQAMDVLMPLWRRYPDHPGLVHYIIHACDTPSLAADGLAAANHYGEIAASGPHAVHMPGHIYARLGMWKQDIDANLASVEASKAAEARHESGWMDQFHSEEFLLYAYLQSGQETRGRSIIAQANTAIDRYESMPGMSPDHWMVGMFPRYRAELPIFLALETRDWNSASTLEPIKGAPPDTQTQVYWARAIADGQLRRLQQARNDLATYDALMDEVKRGKHAYYAQSTGAQIRRQEMTAWAAYAAGDTTEAVRQMRASADLQDKVGQGEVDIPAREMLADILLESGSPKLALDEYKQSMKLSPNRFNGLFNAGKAAEMAGDVTDARAYYAALLKSTDNGSQTSRPEIQHAKTFVSSAGLAR